METLTKLKAGKRVEIPIYNFKVIKGAVGNGAVLLVGKSGFFLNKVMKS